MKYKPEDVQLFLDAVTDPRKELLMQLRSKILDLYPLAETKISYQLLMFKSPTGKLWIGYHKAGVSLYTGYSQQIAEFRAKHPTIKTGKGCINFKLGADIPWDDVTGLIKYAMEFKTLSNQV